jgi:hypothetical protein
VLAVTVAGLAGGCSSGGADAAFRLDELRTAGDTCQPGAISLVLPHAQRHLRLAADDLGGVLAAFDDADAGELVDLGAEGPVAIARVGVDGAESAVLYVSAPSAAPDDVRDATEGILDDL